MLCDRLFTLSSNDICIYCIHKDWEKKFMSLKIWCAVYDISWRERNTQHNRQISNDSSSYTEKSKLVIASIVYRKSREMWEQSEEVRCQWLRHLVRFLSNSPNLLTWEMNKPVSYIVSLSVSGKLSSSEIGNVVNFFMCILIVSKCNSYGRLNSCWLASCNPSKLLVYS